MSTAKNLRAALLGQSDAIDLQAVAARYCNDADRRALDVVLVDLDMATIAHSGLLEGIPLEDIGSAGPYANRAQRAAWAAARLLDCLRAIRAAYQLVEERQAAAKRESVLQRRVEALRIEARAAWKAANVTVPFQDPKHSYRGRTPTWAEFYRQRPDLRPANDDGKQEGKEGGGGLGDTPQSLGLPHLLIERADLRRRQ